MTPAPKPVLPTLADLQPSQAGPTWTFTAEPLVMVFDQITPTGRGIDTWLEIRSTTPPKLLHAAQHNLLNPGTVASITRAILSSMPSWKDADLTGIIQASTYHVIHSMIQGRPPRIAHPLFRPAEDAWLIPGLWRNTMATSLTGTGGTGKSMLAQAAAITHCTGTAQTLGLPASQPGPTLYLDWEGDSQEYDHRYSQLLQGAHLTDPGNLHHLKPQGPLHRQTNTLSRYMDTEGITALIIDSVRYARGDEQAGDNQASTIRLYQTIADLNRPALLVDHRAKHADQLDPTPIGAIANYDSLRLLWNTSSIRTDHGLTIRLHCGKCNYGPMPPDLAWQLDYTPDDRSCTITPRNPAAVSNLEDTGIQDRIHRILLNGPTTVRNITATIGSTDGSIRKHLSRMAQAGTAIKRDTLWYATITDTQQTAVYQDDDAPF
jgi:hypothetical protein